MAKNEEDRLCCALFKHWWKTYPQHRLSLTHIPNGGKRSKFQAGLFQNMGVRPGVSDYFIGVRRGNYPCLWLEVKREKGGRVEPEQITWLQAMREQGHMGIVGFGYEECLFIIDHYMSCQHGAIEWMQESDKKSARNEAWKNDPRAKLWVQ